MHKWTLEQKEKALAKWIKEASPLRLVTMAVSRLVYNTDLTGLQLQKNDGFTDVCLVTSKGEIWCRFSAEPKQVQLVLSGSDQPVTCRWLDVVDKVDQIVNPPSRKHEFWHSN
jgi:hypothetical protein